MCVTVLQNFCGEAWHLSFHSDFQWTWYIIWVQICFLLNALWWYHCWCQSCIWHICKGFNSVTIVHEIIRNDFTNPSSESVLLGKIKPTLFVFLSPQSIMCYRIWYIILCKLIITDNRLTNFNRFLKQCGIWLMVRIFVTFHILESPFWCFNLWVEVMLLENRPSFSNTECLTTAAKAVFRLTGMLVT